MVDVIVDQNDFGDVIGVEVLGARAQLGVAKLGSAVVNESLRWSYDDEMDAFYLRLTLGSASKQTNARAQAAIDAEGNLVSLDVPLPENLSHR